jgi:hypothetical protein
MLQAPRAFYLANNLQGKPPEPLQGYVKKVSFSEKEVKQRAKGHLK